LSHLLEVNTLAKLIFRELPITLKDLQAKGLTAKGYVLDIVKLMLAAKVIYIASAQLGNNPMLMKGAKRNAPRPLASELHQLANSRRRSRVQKKKVTDPQYYLDNRERCLQRRRDRDEMLKKITELQFTDEGRTTWR
jgi:hypothetical protein